VIDQIPRKIPDFSSLIQQPKTSFAPPKHSAINQILLAFLFPQFGQPERSVQGGSLLALGGDELKLFKSRLVMATDPRLSIVVIVLEVLSHRIIGQQSHFHSADRILQVRPMAGKVGRALP
jgi:hypothetical protein